MKINPFVRQAGKSNYFQLLPLFYDGTANGFWKFCYTYLRPLFGNFPAGDKMIEPQRNMFELLYDVNTRYLAERQVATMWYRGGGKTTTSDAFCIWLIIGKWYNDYLDKEARAQGKQLDYTNPAVYLRETRFFAIYSFTKDAAARRLGTIRDVFLRTRTYPEFTLDFGHLLRKRPKPKNHNFYAVEEETDTIKATETVLSFTHNVRGEAFGMGQAIQGANVGGLRPDFLRFDDPENPRDRDNNVDLFRRNIDFITNDCYNAVDKRVGRIHVIGTNIAPGCTIDKLTQEGTMWKKNVYPHVTTPVPLNEQMMYSDEQVCTDPQRFPLELVRLEYERAKSLEDGLRGFFRDMYNIAYDPNSIDVSRIRRYPPDYFVLKYYKNNNYVFCQNWATQKRALITIGVDGGGAKAGNNKTAIVVSALTQDNELIVLDAMLVNKPAMTIDNKGYFDDIRTKIAEYNAEYVVFEAMGGAYQSLFNNLLVHFEKLDKLEGRRYKDKLVPFGDSSKSKSERAFPVLRSFIENDKFYLPDKDSQLFIRQIQTLATGGGGEDDYVDAVVLSQYKATPPSPKIVTFDAQALVLRGNNNLTRNKIVRRFLNRG